MKVLLRVDVDNLGFAGEVHDVADGFGRNFLIPQRLAVKATNAVMKQASSWRKAAEARRAELRAEHETLAARIGEISLTFTARAGDSGKLYGSVTTAQITDMLNEKLGTAIDRRRVGTEPLRQLGEHQLPVRLSSEFQPTLSVIIEPEGIQDLGAGSNGAEEFEQDADELIETPESEAVTESIEASDTETEAS
jgi:large subunit ribosomal protein L9